MRKGLNFNKQQLEEFYLDQKLSLNDIAKKYGCEATNILYWLKKFNIIRRPAYRKKIHINKEVLYDLYWNQNLKPKEIAKLFNIKNDRTIRKKLEKYNIKRKTISEALIKKFKADFSGDLKEKSFLLGLRAGDFYAKQKNKNIRVQTSSTHLAQFELLKSSFANYGETKKYYSKNTQRSDEWFIYTDLNISFGFLLEKIEAIPNWILKDENYFFHFLASYTDCEGNWHITKSHDKHFRFTFRLRTGDLEILKQIKNKFEIKGFTPILTNTGKPHIKSVKSNKDIYALILNKKQDNIELINKLLPLSKHSEKIRKMNLILDNKAKSWKEVEPILQKLKEEIKKEILKK